MPEKVIDQTDSKHEWYIVHTYNLHEEKVAEAIRQKMKALGYHKIVSEILVPKENQIEFKNGKRRAVKKLIFQGYVFIKMKLSDDGQFNKEVWVAIYHTPNVIGFIGDGNTPTPVTADEMNKIIKRGDTDQPSYKITYKVGDIVRIIDGTFKDQEGSVSKVDQQKGKIQVLINIFGRETPIELDALQIKYP